MKKFTVMILMLALMLMSAFSVNGFKITDGSNAEFSSTNPTFGGINQIASNPKDDDASINPNVKDVFAQGTIVVKLAAGETITDLKFLPATGFSGKVKFKFNSIDGANGGLDFTLSSAITADTSLTFEGRIPENLDSIGTDFVYKAFKVATLQAFDSTGSSVGNPFDIYMQRENIFRIDDIDARVISRAGTSKKQSIDPDDPGDKIEKVKPGDSIEFLITCENDADEDSNLDINNGKIDIKVDGRDVSEKEDDDCEADADDKDEVEITIEIDEDAQDQSADVFFMLVGTDENGARHGMKSSGKIEIDRERHDIQITAVRFQPQELQCTDTSLQVIVDVLNLGRSDEDEVAVEVDIRGLGLRDRKSGFELDEDDEDSIVFDFQIDSKTIDAGVHGAQVRTFYDTSSLSSSEVVQITNNCGAEDLDEGVPTTPRTGSQVVSIVLGKTRVNADLGSSVSIPVEVENTGKEFAEFTVMIEGVDDFAEAGAAKRVALNPGQRTNVFLSLNVNDNARTGSYSGTVVVQKGSFEVGSESFEIIVGEAGKATGELSGTTWIILDVILAVLAILVVVMIFRKRR